MPPCEPSSVLKLTDVVAICYRGPKEWVLMVTFWCAPSEDIELEQVDILSNICPMVLVGDFNAKSCIWVKHTVRAISDRFSLEG